MEEEQVKLAESSQAHQKSLAEHHPLKPTNHLLTASNFAGSSAHNNVQVYDIDAYLANPANAALIESATLTPGNENKPLQPVQLGTQTSHYVSALYQACQAKGLTPIFDIEGEANKATFKGVLKVGDVTIAPDEQWRSKKEARERLAERGVELVKGMEVRKREAPGAGLGNEAVKEPNWVGMLQGMSQRTIV